LPKMQKTSPVKRQKCIVTLAMLANDLPMSFREKIVPWAKLPSWRAAVHAKGLRLVVTNGCFDILHLGHVTYLEAARQHGDLLLVGINSDASVRELKGSDRPVNSETDRASIVAALGCVGAVCIFEQRSALQFLVAAEPDVWIKGGDYTIDSVNQDERRAVEKAGGKVVLLPLVPGKSTTTLLEKISRL